MRQPIWDVCAQGTSHLPSVVGQESHTEQEVNVSSASSRPDLGLARRRAHVEILHVGVRRALWGQNEE